MKTGAIAFLDILGFKGIWQHRPEQEILDMLLAVPELVKQTYKAPPPDKGWPAVGEPGVTILSDTVIITFESEHPQTLLLMCTIISAILHHFLKHNIFARGAIGWGRYTQNGPVFLGPAVDDVAMWYEAANWIGVITTPRTNYMIDRLGNRQFEANGKKVDPFIKYDVPLKSGKPILLNVFNWPGLMQTAYVGEGAGNFRQTMTGVFSVQDSIDASVHEKYEQTLKFIDHALKAAI
jgi:hypothetical protein